MESCGHNYLSPVAEEHARHPRNNRPLGQYDGHARITGPCGDTMEFWLKVHEGKIQLATFTTDGCGTSHAAGSMATCLVAGQSLEQAASLAQQDVLEALGGLPPGSEHCALLAANTLKAACEDFRLRLAATASTEAGHCPDGQCASHPSASQRSRPHEILDDDPQLQERLSRIRHKILVLSGKGGVGKSTVAVNLAAALMQAGRRVGLLDTDIHGPSIPTMLGVEEAIIAGPHGEMIPVDVEGLQVMSIGFFLNSPDDPVIWRGPMKMSAIKQMLKDVAWGELDFLIIDSPPGTGDEPLSVCQLIGEVDGAIIVTTPQKVAAVDVRKSISFCRKLEIPVLGVVENMSGFVCPHCGQSTPILSSGGGKRIAEDMQAPFLGSIPIDPMLAESGDAGNAFIQRYSASPTAAIMRQILKPIEELDALKADPINN